MTDLQSTTEKACCEAMGKLIPGLVHELNNPIGSIGNNMQSISEYIEDIKKFLEEIETDLEGTDYGPTFKRKLKEQDINYLLDDTIDATGESKRGINRLSDITQSMQSQFTGTDAGTEPALLQEQITQTLKLLHNELKYSINVHYLPGEDIFFDCSKREIDFVVFFMIHSTVQKIQRAGDISISTSTANSQHTLSISGKAKEVESSKDLHRPDRSNHQIALQIAESNNWNLEERNHGYDLQLPTK